MPIRYPDSELWLTGALRDALAGDAYVGIKIPVDRRSREVIVRGDGGPDRIVTSDQRFGIRVFAATEKATTDLANETSARLRGLRFAGPARKITTTAPYWVDDPSGRPCKYFTAEITVRGEPLA